MLSSASAFSGFSVNDLAAAKKFYREVLGVKVEEQPEGLVLKLQGTTVFIYPKPNHEPATFTVLNFSVKDIDLAVAGLKQKNIVLQHYKGLTDADGIARGIREKRGPDIAWFKDPAGNILSVLQEA